MADIGFPDIPPNATAILIGIGGGLATGVGWLFKARQAERDRIDKVKDDELARRQAKIDQLQDKIENYLTKWTELEGGRQERLGALTRSIDTTNVLVKELIDREKAHK